MLTPQEKELKIAEYLLKSFEEKSPIDYDILDSMHKGSEMTILNTSENYVKKI